MSQLWDMDHLQPALNVPARSLPADESALTDFATRFPACLEQYKFSELDALNRYQEDPFDIPPRVRREAYFNDEHLSYWLSGLCDARKVMDRLGLRKTSPYSVFELGPATGRVMRHLWRDLPLATFFAADLKRSNVEWLRENMKDARITPFHNSALPHIPNESASFDVILAFSVFTHIAMNEEEWLLELRRLLKPGGQIYLTLITDNSWHELGPGRHLEANYRTSKEYNLYQIESPMPQDRVVLHEDYDGPAYLETVIHKRSYIERNWLSFFSSATWHPLGHMFQDVLVLKK